MPTKLNHFKKNFFENIFNYAHGGIAIMSSEGHWLKVNQSVVDFLGYTEDELYNMTFQDITHKDDLDTDINLLHQLLKGTIEHYQIEKRYFHKNGKIVWALLSVSLVRDSKSSPLYFISQIADITRQKQIAWQIKMLLDIVKDQNKKLSDFAQIAAHDIRTHVGNLNTITEFIEEEHQTLHEDDNFIMLKEALLNLNDTLAHLNDVRKEKKVPNEELKALNLYKFVNQAIYNVAAIARHEGCEIVNHVNPTFNIFALEVYLDSIILNFLTNAIKYKTKSGIPRIELNTKSTDEFVILEIKDNGLGIDLEVHKDQIFKLNGTFHEHKDSRGVGLFITKNHIESIHGRIEVTSKVNVGTTFSIYFLKA